MTKELYFIFILIMLVCLVLGAVAFMIGIGTKVDEKSKFISNVLRYIIIGCGCIIGAIMALMLLANIIYILGQLVS